jgi:hypothetical protein
VKGSAAQYRRGNNTVVQGIVVTHNGLVDSVQHALPSSVHDMVPYARLCMTALYICIMASFFVVGVAHDTLLASLGLAVNIMWFMIGVHAHAFDTAVAVPHCTAVHTCGL